MNGVSARGVERKAWGSGRGGARAWLGGSLVVGLGDQVSLWSGRRGGVFLREGGGAWVRLGL